MLHLLVVHFFPTFFFLSLFLSKYIYSLFIYFFIKLIYRLLFRQPAVALPSAQLLLSAAHQMAGENRILFKTIVEKRIKSQMRPAQFVVCPPPGFHGNCPPHTGHSGSCSSSTTRPCWGEDGGKPPTAHPLPRGGKRVY